MKKLTLTFVLLILAIGVSIAQEISKDNYFGSWTDNNSWVGGWSDGTPATLNLPESNADITIKGYIEVGTAPAPTPGSGDILTFKGNKDAYDFIVNDTLVVYGDVNFANKSMNLVIGPGAVFIVMGNLSMNNKIDVASSGTLVVSGNFNKSGSQGSYTGSGDVYAGSFSGDAESTIDAGDGQSSFPIDQLSDDGFGPIENFVNNGGSSPLPITLVSFSIKEVNETVEISWVTSSEENNDYFTIERSVDGTHYEVINQVEGAGNSNEIKQYSIVDKNPSAGKLYYRLSQTDYDGKSEVFDPKGIYISTVKDAIITPNPVRHGEILNIYTGAGKDEQVVVNIYNNAGVVVQSEKISTQSSLLIAENILPGLYVLKIKSGSKQIVKRLIIK